MSPPGNGGAPGEEVIEGAAERIDVAPFAGRAAVARLLGGHVVDRADRGPVAGDALVLGFGLECEAEVDDLDLRRSGESRRLAGLMSRWISPSSDAYLSPSATDRITATASPISSGPSFRTRSWRSPPSTYSRTR